MPTRPRHRVAPVLVALAALAVLAALAAACQKKAATTGTGQAPGRGASVTAGDGDDGTTFTLRPGDHLTVVLSSTTWSFHTPSATVLQAGSVVVTSPSSDCVPTQGCGSVTADFTALAAGTTQVVATRSDCGEGGQGDACSGDAGHYGITVVVSTSAGPPSPSGPGGGGGQGGDQSPQALAAA